MSWEEAAGEAHQTLWLDPKRKVPMFFRWIVPEGEEAVFRIGQRGKGADEEPPHEVVLREPFLLGTFPVTQEQFAVWTASAACREGWFPAHRELLDEGEGPHRNGFPDHPRHPAESLSWHEATAYCAWLNEAGIVPEGLRAELPSEAQWEYGCRGNELSEYHNGDGAAALQEAGWFADNAGECTHEVGGKEANLFRLHDLHGNVSEWCRDYYLDDAWRRQVAGVRDPVVERTEEVAGQEAPEDYVVLAELMGRIADQPKMTPDDLAILARYYPAFKKMGPSWKGVVEATRQALESESGTWPEERTSLASALQADFQRFVQAFGKEGDQPRVLRGGSWSNAADWCRSAYRNRYRAGLRDRYDGFRVCLVGSPAAVPKAGTERTGSEAAGETPGRARRDEGPGRASRQAAERALVSSDGAGWKWNTGSGPVVKVVVGSPSGRSPVRLAESLWEEIRKHWKSLTHLHLWGVERLRELPDLPAALRCLDLRGCATLKEVGPLPGGLEELVLHDCPELVIEAGAGLPELVELSVRKVPGISAGALQDLLGGAPKLREAEVSGCPQLTSLAQWPAGAETLRFNRNPNLVLPEGWPEGMRRLELEGNGAAGLDPLPEDIDFLDFGRMRNLRKLPEHWEGARTLVLHRSGLLEPPVSEHGNAAGENVAEDTRDYFAERELVGSGTVKRCKVLVLGNGEAGKTCLSAGIAERDTRKAMRLGSTDGVQFWTCQRTVPVETGNGKRSYEVDLHLWDFGGQEIYHDLHRLFMEKGAVFVVLWHRDQDGEPGPVSNKPRRDRLPVDQWRPLKYWFDLIRVVCPNNPKIAVVCSHRRESDAELREELRSRIGPEHAADCELFAVDSCPEEDVEAPGPLRPKGEVAGLERWLVASVGEVLSTQGTVVPSYWEIAQEMVERWVQRITSGKKKDARFRKNYRQVPFKKFEKKLGKAIEAGMGRFDKLRERVVAGEFALNEKRVAHTLRFLTRSGWVYWHKDFPERRVIVGQQWALEGIYAVVSRKSEASRRLFAREREGRFTDREFCEWILPGDDFTDADRELLLTFMVQFGYLVQVRDAAATWWSRYSEYLSVMHLPSVPRDLDRYYRRQPAGIEEARATLRSELFHRANWFQMLSRLGESYGSAGDYYRDAFVLEREEDEDLFILVDFDPDGLGATLLAGVRGRKAGEELGELRSWIEAYFPESDSPQLPGPNVAGAGAMKVFLSYTWDPQTGEVPLGYREPVEAIVGRLEGMKRNGMNLEIIRDQDAMTEGDSITEFMENAAQDCDLFIMVQSDKYWMSPNCIHEVWCLDQSWKARQNRIAPEVLVAVEHVPEHDGVDPVIRKSGLSKQSAGEARDEMGSPVEILKDFWTNTPPELGAKYGNLTPAQMAERARVLIPEYIAFLDDRLNRNLKWKRGPEKVLDEIEEKVRKRWKAVRRRR